MLIGMGIDFGIHYIAHYQPLRRDGMDCETALITTSSTVGPGIVSGSVTTAAAFFACILAEFTGIGELGLIAGGGIPALPRIDHRCAAGDHQAGRSSGRQRRRIEAPRKSIPEAIDLLPAFDIPQRIPSFALFLGIAATTLLGYFAIQIKYDHNLLNLQPAGLESIALEEKLLAETDMSVWFASSMADSRKALAMKEKLSQLPTVSRVEEVASVLPDSDPQRPQIIARINERLAKLPSRLPELGNVAPEEVVREVAKFRQTAARAEGEQGGTVTALASLEQAISSLPPQMGVAALAHYQADMSRRFRQAPGDPRRFQSRRHRASKISRRQS